MPAQGSGGVAGHQRTVDYHTSTPHDQSASPPVKASGLNRFITKITGYKSRSQILAAKNLKLSPTPQKSSHDRTIKKHSFLPKLLLKIVPSKTQSFTPTQQNEPTYATVLKGPKKDLAPLKGDSPDFNPLFNKLKLFGNSLQEQQKLKALSQQLRDEAAKDPDISDTTRDNLSKILLDKRAAQKTDLFVEEAKKNHYSSTEIETKANELISRYERFTDIGPVIKQKVAVAQQVLSFFTAANQYSSELYDSATSSEVESSADHFETLPPAIAATTDGLLKTPADLGPLKTLLSEYGNNEQQQQSVKELNETLGQLFETQKVPAANIVKARKVFTQKLASQKVGNLLDRFSDGKKPYSQFSREANALIAQYQRRPQFQKHLKTELKPYLQPQQPAPEQRASQGTKTRQAESTQVQDKAPPVPPRSAASPKRNPVIPQAASFKTLASAIKKLSPHHRQTLEEGQTNQAIKTHFFSLPQPTPAPEDDLMESDPTFQKLSRYKNISSPEATHAGNHRAHANYLLGGTHILAQAPSAKTIHGHLAMILNNHSQISMDFTNKTDLNKNKTIQYIPKPGEKPKVFQGTDPSGRDTIVVSTESALTLPGGTKIYKVLLNDTPVIHMETPIEDKTPGDPVSLVQNTLVSVMLEENLGKTGPTVCHCSAGIGRSGTAVAIKTIVKHYLDTGEKISTEQLDGLINQMRKDRPAAIQTPGQYNTLARVAADVDVYVNALRGAAEEFVEEFLSAQ